MIKVGDKVRCVRKHKMEWDKKNYSKFLRKGKIYEVTEVSDNYSGQPIDCIRVKGDKYLHKLSNFEKVKEKPNESQKN